MNLKCLVKTKSCLSSFLLIFLSSGFIFCSSFIFAQEYERFIGFTIEEGLSSNKAGEIIQDSTGFIWIGTENGLNRYDGYEFKVYKNTKDCENCLPSNDIRCLYIDSKNRLWIGTGLGISQYRPETNDFYTILPDTTYINGPQTNNIYGMAEVNDSTFYIISYAGTLFKLTYPDVIKKVNDSEAYGGAKALLFDQSKHLWIGYSAGLLNILPNGSKTLYNNTDPDSETYIRGKDIQDIIQDPNNKNHLWLCTDQGIILFDKNSRTYQGVEPFSNSDFYVSTALVDSHNNLWFHNYEGVVRKNLSTGNFVVNYPDDCSKYGFKANSLTYVYEDNQENIWLSTNTGIFKVPKTKSFETLNNTSSSRIELSSNQVAPVLIDDKFLMIGYNDGGLDIIDLNTGNIDRLKGEPEDPNTLGSGRIFDLFKDSKGRYWISGYTSGLQKINPVTKAVSTYRHIPGDSTTIPVNDIRSIEEGSDGLLYLSSHSKGITVFDPDTGKVVKVFNHTQNGLMHDWAWQVMMDSNNNLWVTLPGGLCKLSAGSDKFKSYFFSNEDTTSISDNNVNTCFEDSKGRLWFGTLKGLNLYNPEKDNFMRYGENINFANEVIQSIVEDNSGNLWIGTSVGLVQFNPETLEVNNYFEEDGLQSNDFAVQSIDINENGKIVIGGIKGLNIFQPSDIRKSDFKPKVVFTDFLLRNESVSIHKKGSPLKKHISQSEKIVLPYDHKVITFKFTAISHVNPERNQYKYILEGFDNQWNNIQNKREISFTNLNPGDYILKVKGTNNDEVWNEVPATIQITVIPPWYKTIYFYAGVVIFISIFIYLIIKWREKQLKRDKQYLESKIKEEQEKVRKQQDEIRKKDEAEREQRWVDKGVAFFSDLISKNKDHVNNLGQKVLSELIKYINANAGSLTLLNEENESDRHLEVIATYAYESPYSSSKRIELNEGLLGMCFSKGEIISIDELPENYIKVSSGMGEAYPKNLVMVPMKLDELTMGIIEIASFQPISKKELDLINKIGENISSMLYTLRVNKRTNLLLEQTRQSQEELIAQEEELRQNMEEMQATQEDFIRKETEYKQIINRLTVENEKLKDKS